MVNNFGKFCRKLRIDRGELLFDMAKKLGVSSAFLSKVENGNKKPPKEWEDKIIDLYKLDQNKIVELKQFIFEAINYDSIDMSGFNEDNKQLLLSFARKLGSMEDGKKDELKKMFEK